MTARLFPLAAIAAALAASVAVPAPAAYADCLGTTVAGVCTTRRCADPNCFMYEYTITGYCSPPLPPAVCAVSVTVP